MRIAVYNEWDHVPKAEAVGDPRCTLAWDGEYRVNDVIEFTGLTPESFYAVNVDGAVGEALVFVKQETVLYKVPFYEKKTGHNPLSFTGNRHVVMIRKAEAHELEGRRNLSVNPFDQHEESGCYPHASANVETRGEAVFAARNAINGNICTRSHGEWPYESWGINRQEDAELTVDFGRPVDVDEIRLYTRADFPHDNWWVSGVLTFSDGTRLPITMEREVDLPHCYTGLDKRGITWVKLGELVKAEDPSPFPALTQIEVYGCEG